MKKEFTDEVYEEVKAIYGEECLKGAKNKQSSINQQFFAGLYKKFYDPIFEENEQAFFLYNPDNGLWEKAAKSAILNQICMMMKDFAAWRKNDDISLKRNASTINDVIRFLEGICKERNTFERKGQQIIHCGNGVLCFNKESVSWELKDFSPEYRSRNRTKYKYNPDAGCPRFMNELVCSAMSQDDVAHLQYYIGQCLLGENTSQTFVMLTGTAGGGKSTLVNVIENLIGRHNCTELRLEHMSGRFELQRLVGKTLLTAKDVQSSFLNSKGAYKLKALTGNDTMTIESKGRNEAIDIDCSFNAIITSNSTLHVSVDGDTEAWKRRLIWIRYENPPPKTPIVDFDKKILAEEGSGIMNWALDGAAKLIQANGRIPKSVEQLDRIDALLKESDSIQAFVEKCIIPQRGETVTISEIVETFQSFCTMHNWQMLPERYIQSRLPDYMLMKYGAVKRTDIKRDGKSNRGYANFKIVNIQAIAS